MAISEQQKTIIRFESDCASHSIQIPTWQLLTSEKVHPDIRQRIKKAYLDLTSKNPHQSAVKKGNQIRRALAEIAGRKECEPFRKQILAEEEIIDISKDVIF